MFSKRQTFVDVLAARLAQWPDEEVCRLVDRSGAETVITVRTLMDKVQAYAERYGARAGTEPKLVAVCLYHSLDLLAAFLGAMWAGHIPTMLPPPSPRMEATKYSTALKGMIGHIQPDFLVLDAQAAEKLEGHAAISASQDPSSPTFILADSVPASASAPPSPLFHPHEDDIALLQHSSGTTGLQKGVALSHRQLLAHNAAYTERLNVSPSDTIVSWLPLYHDMGLIACFVMPLLSRVRFIQLSPFDWVLRPDSLLEKIHAHRATLCWLPNFAYTFMAETVRETTLEGSPEGKGPLDLSTIRAFVNCSEPVYQRSHEAFLARFTKNGVRADQLTASYAMAENVFAVSQSLPGKAHTLTVERAAFNAEHRIAPLSNPNGGEASLSFVSNGPPVRGTEVVVLEPDSESTVAPGTVGELAIKGPYCFSGYFRRPDLTQQAMTAAGFYRTGDLGFLHEGELYVTGRKKDLLILKGKNFYPGDIEAVVSQLDGVAAGRAVAFSVPDERAGTDRLIILAEASTELSDVDGKRLALRIRQTVSMELDVTPGDVRIVPSRWLVKSTSGKLARHDNRTKYQSTFHAGKD